MGATNDNSVTCNNKLLALDNDALVSMTSRSTLPLIIFVCTGYSLTFNVILLGIIVVQIHILKVDFSSSHSKKSRTKSTNIIE